MIQKCVVESRYKGFVEEQDKEIQLLSQRPNGNPTEVKRKQESALSPCDSLGGLLQTGPTPPRSFILVNLNHFCRNIVVMRQIKCERLRDDKKVDVTARDFLFTSRG